MAVILVFTSHMDGVCNIIFTLPGTSDYYVQNIVNIRIALSVIGEESICSHMDFGDFQFSLFQQKMKALMRLCGCKVFECYHFLGS